MGGAPVTHRDQVDLRSLFGFFKFEELDASTAVACNNARIIYELAPASHLEPTEDGRLHARFEILIGAYDEGNRTMFGYRSPLEKMYVLKSADDAKKKAIRLRHVVEIPAAAAWLRVAVRDAIGDRLGSVEIPLPVPVKLPAKANDTGR